jgi:quercetin dioxygenase-like cupin family protein
MSTKDGGSLLTGKCGIVGFDICLLHAYHLIMTNNVSDISMMEWRPVRPEVTRGVFGKTLLDEKVKAVLTRVEPGGKFRTHADKYAHLFYFLEGEGVVQVGDQSHKAVAGVTVQVAAGEIHSYENTGKTDLLLISMNLPAE